MKNALSLIILCLIAIQGKAQGEFITTWKTNNPGTSNATSITIPTYWGEIYNYDVSWKNDGVWENGFTGNASHDYGTDGTYTVAIRGSFPRIFFDNGGDKQKILSIEQWGNISWSSMQNSFYGCINLLGNASDIPNLSTVTDMSRMFAKASAFNQDIGNWNVGNVMYMTSMFWNAFAFNQDIGSWNVSNVKNTFYMFANATTFNQNIGNWNVGNVTDMRFMFTGVNLSRENYDALLNGWSAQNLQNGVTFDGGNSQYCTGGTARNTMLNNYGWTITDGGENCSSTYFITTWKTDNLNYGSSNATSIIIPTNSDETYNYDVSWKNDGVWETGFTGNAIHDYGAGNEGTYTVAIRGDFPQIYFNNVGDKRKLISIDQWGAINWSSMQNAFHGCSKLISNATDTPDLSSVTNMSYMFARASIFNGDIGDWNVGNVTDMQNLFFYAFDFNGDIGNWNVNNVVEMQYMFNYAFAFNQDIGIWNVANVTDMQYIFSNAEDFNQDIGNWNVSNVTNMKRMFYSASAFNQDIGNWNVSNATNMQSMFHGASAFNQDIGNWNVSNVTDMAIMFYGASAFNQDIGNWNVSNASSMAHMFYNASAFNQDIGNWNVSNVSKMNNMFGWAVDFNGDIGNWDVSNVTTMQYMFDHASTFNQNIGNWDVSNVLSMYKMFDRANLSTANYDALLNGWSALNLKNTVAFSAGNSQYCTGETARASIISNFGWAITDGGLNCDSCGPVTTYTTLAGWSNGVPTTGKKAVFADDYNTSIGSIVACEIEIAENVTVTVSEGTTIQAENDIVITGDLIFLSSAAGNGELAAMGATSSIIGNATVQRYMSDYRAYRMVSPAVTTTTSINANWQEGVHNIVTTYGDNQNPNPGFGTHITGSQTGANGFDATSTGNASMFTVNVATQQFEVIGNTDTNTLTAGEGYLMYVRGDRSINLTDNSAHSETVLRATGSLATGTNTQNFTTEEEGDFVMFGNPYQSAVDVNSLFDGSINVNDTQYYVYDPSMATNGAYVTITLPEGSNTSNSDANQYLQPGQAAQVATLAAGASSVIFNETDKAPGNYTATNRPTAGNDMLTVQLYTTENFSTGGPVHDSFGILFADGNDSGLTPTDAVKPMNFYENFGINHDGTYLSLERRDMPQPEDVYPLYSTGYSQTDYTLKLIVDGLDNSILYLDDNFTGTSTLLEIGETVYGFNVNAGEPLSKATDRFSIRTEQPLGVEDNNLLSGIRLYPNPLNADTFYINAPRLNGEQLIVSISDLSGRRIYDNSLECNANTVTVPMGSVASGIYLVTLKHGGEANTYRLIKE